MRTRMAPSLRERTSDAKSSGEVKSGGTKLDRGYVVLNVPTEKKQELLPALSGSNGLSLATATRSKLRPMRSVRRKKKKGGKISKLPRELELNPVYHAVFRFGVTADISLQSVSTANLFGVCGGICSVANTTISGIVSGVRVKHVDVFPAAQASSIKAMNAMVDYAGVSNFERDSTKNRMMPYGISVGSATRFAPPSWSLSRDWLNASATGAVFTITVGVGAVVDLSMDFTLRNNNATINQTIAAGTLGVMYYLALDGPAQNKIVPVGRPTTA